MFSVDYCLAQPAPQRCELDLSIGILAFVIVCNVAKITCFFYTLSLDKFEPLITIGDAIKSFLANPDHTTSSLGLLDAHAVRMGQLVLAKSEDGLFANQTLGLLSQHSRRRWRWSKAASRSRWVLTLVACIILLLVCFVLFGLGLGDQGLDFDDFGVIDTSYLLDWSDTLIGSVLVANTPQFLISLVYLLYNALFTCMAVSSEYTSYAQRRRTLRVSSPHGAQRSTHWLQLKYRYAIPFMGTMATLHWLVSESIYLVYLESYDWVGVLEMAYDQCAWNSAATLLSCIVGAALIMFLIITGLCRKYPAGIPLASTCSLAISAACQRSKDDDEDVVLKPLKYGVLKDVGPNGLHRVGFSAEPVEPLENGESYD